VNCLGALADAALADVGAWRWSAGHRVDARQRLLDQQCSGELAVLRGRGWLHLTVTPIEQH
jgi:hypothetical protein